MAAQQREARKRAEQMHQHARPPQRVADHVVDRLQTDDRERGMIPRTAFVTPGRSVAGVRSLRTTTCMIPLSVIEPRIRNVVKIRGNCWSRK